MLRSVGKRAGERYPTVLNGTHVGPYGLRPGCKGSVGSASSAAADIAPGGYGPWKGRKKQDCIESFLQLRQPSCSERSNPHDYRSFFFFSTPAQYAFWVVYCFWIIADNGVVYLVGRHKTGAVKKGDRGSYWVVVASLVVLIWVAFVLRWFGIGLLPAWVEWPGLALMLLGVTLRAWAVLLLGHFFSTRVELQASHYVVSTGPYRYIRHPAYTGSLITVAGVGLALGSWVAALLILVIFRVVFSYRVRVEEAFLLSSFGEDYREYMGRTGRFFPRFAGPAQKAKSG